MKRAAPPDAEWWDEPLLPSQKYDDLQHGMGYLHIHTEDSPITIYIQHPIPIPAPGDKNKIALKPMMLTKKVCRIFHQSVLNCNKFLGKQEQKKMRKLRRAGELQDKRDRIRMGLLPPDAPKGAFLPRHILLRPAD